MTEMVYLYDGSFEGFLCCIFDNSRIANLLFGCVCQLL